MKLPSEVIPKFIISLDKNKERQDYLKKEVYPKLTNYFKCAAFDAELDDANEILKDNNIFLTDSFYDKCNEGQLGCFLSHFQLWKYIIKSNIDIAVVLEDDVKIYNNFNKNIDTIYENLPVKFDYVHLFIHPDKQNIQYLDGKDGDIIPAEDNFGTVAYIVSLRGAKRLVKLTELLKIQAPVDRQINFYIQHNFIKAFMIKKPFLLTQGEIMPNRAIYENSFKSTIWYSKKLKDAKKVKDRASWSNFRSKYSETDVMRAYALQVAIATLSKVYKSVDPEARLDIFNKVLIKFNILISLASLIIVTISPNSKSLNDKKSFLSFVIMG